MKEDKKGLERSIEHFFVLRSLVFFLYSFVLNHISDIQEDQSRNSLMNVPSSLNNAFISRSPRSPSIS